MNLTAITTEARNREGIMSAETLPGCTKGDRVTWVGRTLGIA